MGINKSQLQELIDAIDAGLARNRAVAPVYGALYMSEQKLIPGITAADALDAGDAIGTLFTIAVPKAGWLNCIRLYDPDDDTLALTANFFMKPFNPTTSDGALNIAAADTLQAVCAVPMTVTTDLGGGKIASFPGLNEPYVAPDGLLYIQCSTAGTPSIASATVMPRLQVYVIPALTYVLPPLNTV